MSQPMSRYCQFAAIFLAAILGQVALLVLVAIVDEVSGSRLFVSLTDVYFLARMLVEPIELCDRGGWGAIGCEILLVYGFGIPAFSAAIASTTLLLLHLKRR